jgi:hypothetical protein
MQHKVVPILTKKKNTNINININQSVLFIVQFYIMRINFTFYVLLLIFMEDP